MATELAWKGSLSEFQLRKNEFIPYNFSIEKNSTIELPQDWYEEEELFGRAPMVRTESDGLGFECKGGRNYGEIFASHVSQEQVW